MAHYLHDTYFSHQKDYSDQIRDLMVKGNLLVDEEFALYAIRLGWDIQYLQDYWVVTEDLLDREFERIRVMAEGDIGKNDPTSVDHKLAEFSLNLGTSLTESLAQFQRRSVLVAFYSKLEFSLGEVTRFLAGDDTLLFNNLLATKNYLTDVLKIRYSFGNR